MNAVLSNIKTLKAKEFILDISGVGVVDTAVANYLINISKATSLMGCRATISGISPAISKTIIQLGIDVGNVNTTATMMDALAKAFDSQGLAIYSTKAHAKQS
jgi:rsbT co-antagonist protein RsbR